MRCLANSAACLLGNVAILLASTSVLAEDRIIEEIIVTARQQAETLQDVPVTVAAMTQEDLRRYNITNLADAAKMVPNMIIAQGGSGNGATLRLRGIGSSSISAAFDHSVALNIDGVVVNRGRFIHNAYLDMRQIEVLKGPQSLYFGKSATAGVVSIQTNDPGDEFELELAGGVETEHEGTTAEVVISGPLTDTFGARLAVGVIENDEMFKNYSHDHDPLADFIGTEKWFGDKALNSRLTLVWAPTDTFNAKLKYSYSEYENNGGGTMWAEEICPEGFNQPVAIPSVAAAFRLFEPVDDCKLNGNTSKVYLYPGQGAGLPHGWDDRKTGLDQDTDFLSIRADWDFHPDYTLTSVTGWVDLHHEELDEYAYGAGVYWGLGINDYESLSQEFRLATHYDGPINFQAGVYYQDVEQVFDAYQGGISVTPNIFGDPSMVIGPDPATGNEYNYEKKHTTDTEAWSGYLAVYWDINERTELTFGARYTDEQKDGKIEFPFIHEVATLLGFVAPPGGVQGLQFKDDNLSPEVAINYYVTPDVSVFAAYKEAFKSGGIDNSILPRSNIDPSSPDFMGYDFLYYDSEKADGFEIGMKGRFFDGSLSLNATAFTYEYTDLQVQLFESSLIQFVTFNASALETKGVEFDLLWQTGVEGLLIRSAWAFTDTTYSDDFFTTDGQNLKGENGALNSPITGFVGFTYDVPVTGQWRVSLSTDARYSDGYDISASLNPYEQDSFWLVDMALSVYSVNGRHQLNLIGRNVGDEIYAVGAGPIPGKCVGNPTATPFGCQNTADPNTLDQAATTQLGRTITLQYRFTL